MYSQLARQYTHRELSMRFPAIAYTGDLNPDAPYILTTDQGVFLDYKGKRLVLGMGHEKILDANFITSGVFSRDVPSSFILETEDALTVAHSKSLLSKPQLLVEVAFEIAKRSPDKVRYFPFSGDPAFLPLLVYLGFDLFDTSWAEMAAYRKSYLSFMGEKCVKELSSFPCPCPVCADKVMGIEEIGSHNINFAVSEINAIHEAIRNQNLRELVMSRGMFHPEVLCAFRILNKNYDRLEPFTPLNQPTYLMTTDALSYPEVLRHVNKMYRYKPPQCLSTAVFLPCSAKKPYSMSKTHKFIRERLFSSLPPGSFHEIIITSPLGAVARELECFPVSRNYDAVVTGSWSHEEKNYIFTILDKLKGHYTQVISHLPEDLDFVTEYLQDEFCAINTCRDGRVLSPESLQQLNNTVQDISKDFQIPERHKVLRNFTENIFNYQFGLNIDDVWPDINIKGKFPFIKIFDGNGRQLASYPVDKGTLSLTLDGASYFAKKGIFTVEIEDFHPRGDIFNIGIIDADKNMRPGDEAVIVHNGELRAVGVLVSPAIVAGALKTGIGVKVRHFVRNDNASSKNIDNKRKANV